MAGHTRPASGLVLHLDDAQYRFGTGTLICRVIDVLDLLDLDDGPPWWHLLGDCALGVPTHHGSWHRRELYVVSTAVPRPGKRSGDRHGGSGE